MRPHNRTQQDSADLLHISRRTDSAYENAVPPDILIAPARLCGTGADYLPGLSDGPAPYPRKTPKQ